MGWPAVSETWAERDTVNRVQARPSGERRWGAGLRARGRGGDCVLAVTASTKASRRRRAWERSGDNAEQLEFGRGGVCVVYCVGLGPPASIRLVICVLKGRGNPSLPVTVF